MSLSREERRALDDLERQLTGDPELDIALSSLPDDEQTSRQWWRRPALGWVAIAAGAVATIAMLAVSVVISFIAFVILLGGVAVVIGPHPLGAMRQFVADNRDFGRGDPGPTREP